MSSRASAALAALIAPAALLLAGGSLVDPTRPPALPIESPPGTPEAAGDGAGAPAPPRVSSILVSPERRVAVVDGVRVAVGDRVGAARVVGISLAAVHLRGPGGSFELPLYGTPVVKREAGGW